jgi:hypothetical protein
MLWVSLLDFKQQFLLSLLNLEGLEYLRDNFLHTIAVDVRASYLISRRQDAVLGQLTLNFEFQNLGLGVNALQELLLLIFRDEHRLSLITLDEEVCRVQ